MTTSSDPDRSAGRTAHSSRFFLRLQNAAILPVLPAILAPAAVLIGARVGGRITLPILATLAIYPVLALLILRGWRGVATLAALLWAVSLSISVIAYSSYDP